MKKFKYENLKTVADIFEKDFTFGTFDLRHGYHHIPIAEEDQKYLGFSWTFPDGRTRFFVFLVLPFGLASACYAFTKLMRPLVKKWRSMGFRVVVYLDDGIFGSHSVHLTKQHSLIIKYYLERAGLTINTKKSNFEPSTIGKWLGFEIDTHLMIFKVPAQKIQHLKNLIIECLSATKVTAKQISRISGRIISMSLAFGNIARLFTRQMYKFIESRKFWFKPEIISVELFSELKFWLEGLDNNNGFRIKQNIQTTKVVYSDASGTGYGGYIVDRLGNEIARGTFTEFERGTSSTYRELLAVKNVLQSVGFLLRNESVQWNTDNINVVRIIQAGSSKEHLQAKAIEIYEFCICYDIEIFPLWIPREQNEIADHIFLST